MEDPRFPRTFQLVERPGFYCRVLATGMLRSEASVVFKAFDDTRISVLEVFRNRYAANLTTQTIEVQNRSHDMLVVLQPIRAVGEVGTLLNDHGSARPSQVLPFRLQVELPLQRTRSVVDGRPSEGG